MCVGITWIQKSVANKAFPKIKKDNFLSSSCVKFGERFDQLASRPGCFKDTLMAWPRKFAVIWGSGCRSWLDALKDFWDRQFRAFATLFRPRQANKLGIVRIIQDGVYTRMYQRCMHGFKFWFARRSSQSLLAEKFCFQEIACSHKVGQGHCPQWKLYDFYASCSLGWLNFYLSTTCSSWILSVKSGVCGKSWRWLKPKFKRTRTLAARLRIIVYAKWMLW